MAILLLLAAAAAVLPQADGQLFSEERRGLTAAEKQQALDEHNEVRASVGARNMRQLVSQCMHADLRTLQQACSSCKVKRLGIYYVCS